MKACFKIFSSVRHGHIISLCLEVQCVCSDERGDDGNEISGGGERVEIIYLLYADNLVLCVKLEEGLPVMVGCFIYVCKRRGL